MVSAMLWVGEVEKEGNKTKMGIKKRKIYALVMILSIVFGMIRTTSSAAQIEDWEQAYYSICYEVFCEESKQQLIDPDYYSRFTVYDMDRDGQYELLIQNYFSTDVYTYQSGRAVKIGSMDTHHRQLYAQPNGRGIISYYGGIEATCLDCWYIEHNRLEYEEIVFEKSVGGKAREPRSFLPGSCKLVMFNTIYADAVYTYREWAYPYNKAYTDLLIDGIHYGELIEWTSDTMTVAIMQVDGIYPESQNYQLSYAGQVATLDISRARIQLEGAWSGWSSGMTQYRSIDDALNAKVFGGSARLRDVCSMQVEFVTDGLYVTEITFLYAA